MKAKRVGAKAKRVNPNKESGKAGNIRTSRLNRKRVGKVEKRAGKYIV